MTPREKVAFPYAWRVHGRPEQIEPAGDWRTWLVMAGRGFGKMVSMNTLLPTPHGWITMVDVKTGDEVFDESGRVCRVTFVSDPEIPERAYRLFFSDGTHLDACSDHQWVTWTHAERKAFIRSPYEDTSRFPAEWPSWRLKRRLGGTDLKVGVIEESLRLHASGLSARAIEKTIGVDRHALARHIRAGRYVERSAVVHEDSPGPCVRTTEEIVRTLTYGKRNDLNHCIPNCGPLVLPDLDLPVPPYTLGVWLGDGSSSDGTVTSHQDDQPFIRPPIEADGFPTTNRKQSDSHKCPNFGTLGLSTKLRVLGLRNNKHVPSVYFRASISQRLALLQGLMDTDGGVEGGSHVAFTSCLEHLADAVYELVVSLGMRATRSQRPSKLNGVVFGTSYRVAFTPTMQVFRLPRKADRVRFDVGQLLSRHHRTITGAKRIEPKPMRCIAVDSPHRMYLCGRAMIPTHNTRTGAEWVRHRVENCGKRRIALIAPTAADARDVMVLGESGLLAICPPWNKPKYEPSKRRLTWPNGAIATTYSADEPERLRGPQHDDAWGDEIGSWRRPAAYDMLMFGLRLGDSPRLCLTTTPRPTSLLKQVLASPTTVKTGGSTYENRANLAADFIEMVEARYEGTRLGRQEVHAELLETLEGAWFPQFSPPRHVSIKAEYVPGIPVRLAIDCGVSGCTGAVFFQVREVAPYRNLVTVFGDYYASGLYSEANAVAIQATAGELCGGTLDVVRLDPASTARTGVGPAAYGEYEKVFGRRQLGFWPQHLVSDGLDQIELLLGPETREPDLLIHPRAVHLIAAFNTYVHAERGGEFMPWPLDPNHPAEDLMDALRGGVRDALPEGRVPQPAYPRVPFRRVF